MRILSGDLSSAAKHIAVFCALVVCFVLIASLDNRREEFAYDWASSVPFVDNSSNLVLVPKNEFPVFQEVWTYKCKPGSGCIRSRRDPNETIVEPEVCWLTCGEYGPLWPYPTKTAQLGPCRVGFRLETVKLNLSTVPSEDVKALLLKMWGVFHERTIRISGVSGHSNPTETKSNNTVDFVDVKVWIESGSTSMNLKTDESYYILVNLDSANLQTVKADCQFKHGLGLNVIIKAATVYGARHGLETLTQLIAYDHHERLYKIISGAEIKDKPAFNYRGILIDTARNFIPIPDLERMIDGLAMNKLNVFHWHLTDSNSFSFVSKRVPWMAQFGAYSQEQVYHPSQIKALISYARVRGVKVIPELDGPAHAGNGWEWGESEGLGHLAVCVNKEPWRGYCGQPPCGQLNPLNPNTYDVLGKLYKDFLELFDNDIFHMGGDEVYYQCWESELSEYQNSTFSWSNGYINIWGEFQEKAFQLLQAAIGKREGGDETKAVVWTSGLTSHGRQYLDPAKYIIQVWDGNAGLVRGLLNDGYQIIMSNVDAMYFDHGGGTWLGKEHIYAYKLWQQAYDNKLPIKSGQVLGGEATLWTEKMNAQNIDARTWPRGAAVAENLWSNPTRRSPFVLSRLNHHNRRLIRQGIHADQLQPESCYLIYGHCDDPNNPI